MWLKILHESEIMTSLRQDGLPMSKDKKSSNKDDKAKKKNTSLRLDSKTLKALKLRAIEEDTSVQRIIETLVEDYLKKS
jgi:hypothetical protein